MKRVNVLAGHVAGYTVQDLVEKREQGQVWIAIRNKVYDVTEFLDEHPGGAELITDIPVEDVQQMTAEFEDAEHSEEAMEQLAPLFKGILLAEDGSTPMGGAAAAGGGEEEEEEEHDDAQIQNQVNTEYTPNPFHSTTNCKLLLDSKHELSHDVTVYRFQLPRIDKDSFSLAIGKHIVLSYEEMDGKHVSRAYTPVSPFGDRGFVDFLIKSYPGGKMSEHLKTLRPQVDSLQMFGPKGKLAYLGDGKFSIRKQGQEHFVDLKHVGMVCGGSGITPMFQIVQAVARNPHDGLKITLVFGNKTEEDMILRHALDALQQLKARGQLEIVYTLDQPPTNPETFTGVVGFITKDLLAKHLPAPGNDSMVFLCGPPGLINKACLPALKDLGFPKDRIFKF